MDNTKNNKHSLLTPNIEISKTLSKTLSLVKIYNRCTRIVKRVLGQLSTITANNYISVTKFHNNFRKLEKFTIENETSTQHIEM